MPVNETSLEAAIEGLSRTRSYLRDRRRECTDMMILLESLRKVDPSPPAEPVDMGTPPPGPAGQAAARRRMVNPIDPGTGARMTASRRNAIYDAHIASARALIALRPSTDSDDDDDSGDEDEGEDGDSEDSDDPAPPGPSGQGGQG